MSGQWWSRWGLPLAQRLLHVLSRRRTPVPGQVVSCHASRGVQLTGADDDAHDSLEALRLRDPAGVFGYRNAGYAAAP